MAGRGGAWWRVVITQQRLGVASHLVTDESPLPFINAENMVYRVECQ
jgi:hypothetical protein